LIAKTTVPFVNITLAFTAGLTETKAGESA